MILARFPQAARRFDDERNPVNCVGNSCSVKKLEPLAERLAMIARNYYACILPLSSSFDDFKQRFQSFVEYRYSGAIESSNHFTTFSFDLGLTPIPTQTSLRN